jgi:hypothetical protein
LENHTIATEYWRDKAIQEMKKEMPDLILIQACQMMIKRHDSGTVAGRTGAGHKSYSDPAAGNGHAESAAMEQQAAAAQAGAAQTGDAQTPSCKSKLWKASGSARTSTSR